MNIFNKLWRHVFPEPNSMNLGGLLDTYQTAQQQIAWLRVMGKPDGTLPHYAQPEPGTFPILRGRPVSTWSAVRIFGAHFRDYWMIARGKTLREHG